MTQADPIQTDGLHCPECSYNLFGITSDVCPECGQAIDRTNLGNSGIPWSHRKQIGSVRAFLRTCWLATFHSKKLANEINRPVSVEDAQRFRLACIALATIPPVCLAGWGFIASGEFNGWEAATGIAVSLASIWLFLLAMTGLPGIFFHPEHLQVLRQNRAVAICYYNAAPLAWLGIPTAFLAFALLIYSRLGANQFGSWSSVFLVICSFTCAILLFRVAAGNATLLKRITRCSSTKAWVLFFAQPIAWIVLAGVFFGALPLVALFVAVVISSLR